MLFNYISGSQQLYSTPANKTTVMSNESILMFFHTNKEDLLFTAWEFHCLNVTLPLFKLHLKYDLDWERSGKITKEPWDPLVSSANTVEQLAMCWHCTVQHTVYHKERHMYLLLTFIFFCLFYFCGWSENVLWEWHSNQTWSLLQLNLNVTTHTLNTAVIWKITTFFALQNAALARNWHHAWVLHLKKKKDCRLVDLWAFQGQR